MGMAQTSRPITTIIEKTVFAEMQERTGVGHKRQGRVETFMR